MAVFGWWWIIVGACGKADFVVVGLVLVAGVVLALAVFLGLVVLGVWSVAGFWGFLDVLLDRIIMVNWLCFGFGILQVLGEIVLIAVVVALVALVLTIGCLEVEYRYKLCVSQRVVWVLYILLLVLQMAFLLGL